MKRLTIQFILPLLLLLLFTLLSLGDSITYQGNRMIEQNSTLAPFSLTDQFGEEHNLNPMPKLLICSFGKESGTLISSYFNAQSSDYLTQHNIKLLADISAVPAMLRKMIILPKMKKNSFSILLSTDEAFSKQFPKEDGALTILKLEDGLVKIIEFAKDEAELKSIIE